MGHHITPGTRRLRRDSVAKNEEASENRYTKTNNLLSETWDIKRLNYSVRLGHGTCYFCYLLISFTPRVEKITPDTRKWRLMHGFPGGWIFNYGTERHSVCFEPGFVVRYPSSFKQKLEVVWTGELWVFGPVRRENSSYVCIAAALFVSCSNISLVDITPSKSKCTTWNDMKGIPQVVFIYLSHSIALSNNLCFFELGTFHLGWSLLSQTFRTTRNPVQLQDMIASLVLSYLSLIFWEYLVCSNQETNPNYSCLNSVVSSSWEVKIC